jgi:lysophospholipase L1-like esterase
VPVAIIKPKSWPKERCLGFYGSDMQSLRYFPRLMDIRMSKYLLLSIYLVFVCTGECFAAIGADSVPQSAASFQQLYPLPHNGIKGWQAPWQDSNNFGNHVPIKFVSGKYDQRGPTPYPRNESDWPGAGVIRIFDWMAWNRQYFWSQRLANQGAVVFIGDSLIAGWKTLKDDFAPLHVANVGIGGDVSRGVLFRLQEDVIDLTPKAVVILIGTNDLSANEDLSLLISNLMSIVKLLREYDQFLPIVLCNLPPRDSETYPISNMVLALNSRLGSLSISDSKLVLLDLYRFLASPDGSIDPQNLEADKLHISPAGYRKFHDALIQVFRTLQVQ